VRRLAQVGTRKALSQLFLAFLCLVGLLHPRSAPALDSTRRISQYGHTAWRLQDGFLNGTPNAIAQTKDGYLWIGTDAGLLRFDGVRFVTWSAPPEGLQLPSGAIQSLLATKDGSLWIAGHGLSLWKDGNLTNYPIAGRLNAIVEDPAGGLWIARSRVAADKTGPACHFLAGKFNCFGNADGLSLLGANAAVVGQGGELWVGGSAGLARGRAGSFSTLAPNRLKSHEALNGINALAPGSKGTLFVGISHSGQGLGLQLLMNGALTPVLAPHFDGATLEVSTLLADGDGTLWVGTDTQGIFRIGKNGADQYRSTDGLSSDAVTAFLRDYEGNLWVLTTRGVDCFRDLKVTTFSARQGLSSDYAGSILAAQDGTIWVGNHDALDSLHDNEVHSIRQRDGLPGKRVTAILQDHLGRLWVGVDNTLSIYVHGRFHRIRMANGKDIGPINSLAEETNGDIWAHPIPSSTRLVHVHGAVASDVLLPGASRIVSIAGGLDDGVWVGRADGSFGRYRNSQLQMVKDDTKISNISMMQAMPDGALWRSASGRLLVWRHGTSQQLTVKNGLPCELMNSFAFDLTGTLWIYADCGLIEIQDAELKRWLAYPQAKLETRLFDVFDGVEAAAPSFNPKASRSTDGRLWFVNDSVVQMIDPSRIPVNVLAPPVHIEEVVADQKSWLPRDGLRLPALTRNLEIDYTALSLLVPRKVRFRYKLTGRDPSWQEPGLRRQAFYNDLAPGRYRFQVIACNNDGVWNEKGATLDFFIEPAFYQTIWFKALLWVAGLGFLLFFFRLRLSYVTEQMQARLEERLSERERIARELHDTLLQGFQGLMLRFQTAIDERDQVQSHRMMELAMDRADEVLIEGRQRVHALRADSIVVKELSAALAAYGEELATQYSIPFRMTLVGTPAVLDPLVRDECYRIGREALLNAFQHSGASQVEAEVSYDRAVVHLRVRDNGRGMELNILTEGRPGHWGIFGMRERASEIGAELNIWSKPSAGTEIDLSVPGHKIYRNERSRLRWPRIWIWNRSQVKR
jgi:signal transduction histidine kinase/ligand-binding sensor domain-containing protein